MTNDEIIEGPLFCLHCGKRISVQCDYDGDNFYVECSGDGGPFTRAQETVYAEALDKWWVARKQAYFDQRSDPWALSDIMFERRVEAR